MLKIYISDGIREKLNGSPSCLIATWDKFSYQWPEIKDFVYDEANLKQNGTTKPENQKDVYVRT